MIPAAFDYRAPRTLDEALAILAKHGDAARVLAGGHGLVPALKLRVERPSLVVDLRRIPGLDAIAEGSVDGAPALEIGALATLSDVAASPVVRDRCPLLAEVAAQVGDPQVRSFATLGGAACQADHGADLPAALLALDACIVAEGRGGSRSIPAASFLAGPARSALERGEVVRSVCIPLPSMPGFAYAKVRRDTSGFALVGAAACLRLAGDRIESAAVAVTGAAARPFRAQAVEEALRGAKPDAETISRAASGVTAGRDLLGDSRASPEYRAHLSSVLARRALERAMTSASLHPRSS